MNKGLGGNSTVVELRPGRTAASEDTLQLVGELRRMTTAVLTLQLTRMFEGADDLLFEFAERAASNGEQRLYFDTMRTVRLGRPEMLQRFVESMAKGFEGRAPNASEPRAAVAEDDFALQDSGTLEKDIAITNMAAKAEGLYRQALWELGRKFSVLVDTLHAPIAVDALSPQRIGDAFRAGAEALNVELRIELVIYKLFDRLVIGELGELYAKALHLLKQHGIQAAIPAAPVPAPPSAFQTAGAPTPAAMAPPPALHAPMAPPVQPASAFRSTEIGPAALPGWSQAIASMAGSFGGGFGPVPGNTAPPVRISNSATAMPPLDPQTLTALARLEAADRSAIRYGNAQLAADLSAAARGQSIAGWAPSQATAYVQRTGLVGQMFNEILADPHLPESLRRPFDSLRLSVIKTALDDPHFIADPAHPVRSLVNELAAIAAAARTAEAETLRRTERLVDEIRSQFEVAADAVRAPTAQAEPMAPEAAARFIEQQSSQAEVRRLAMVRKVRRIVAEELQLRTLGVSLPLDVRPLLYSAWAPMMSVHLLKGGPDGAEWRAGIAQLEALLAALDPSSPIAADPARRETLTVSLRTGFAAVGLVDNRIDSVLEGLDKALDAVKQAPPASAVLATPGDGERDETGPVAPTAAPAITARQLLDQLIVPGAWFRLYDRDRQCSRWLKAVAFYPGMDCAAFAEFNGKNTLLVKAGLLLDDLLAQRAEPLDVLPATRRGLQEFVAQHKPAVA